MLAERMRGNFLRGHENTFGHANLCVSRLTRQTRACPVYGSKLNHSIENTFSATLYKQSNAALPRVCSRYSAGVLRFMFSVPSFMQAQPQCPDICNLVRNYLPVCSVVPAAAPRVAKPTPAATSVRKLAIKSFVRFSIFITSER